MQTPGQRKIQNDRRHYLNFVKRVANLEIDHIEAVDEARLSDIIEEAKEVLRATGR